MFQNFRPIVKIVTYQLNTDSLYYDLQTQPPAFNRLPKELQVQDSLSKPMIDRGAMQIIQGRTVNKKRTFFSGMQTTPNRNTFYGDDGYIRPKKPSFCLFHFSNDCTRLNFHYFSGFIPLNPMREEFIQTYLRTLK